MELEEAKKLNAVRQDLKHDKELIVQQLNRAEETGDINVDKLPRELRKKVKALLETEKTLTEQQFRELDEELYGEAKQGEMFK